MAMSLLSCLPTSVQREQDFPSQLRGSPHLLHLDLALVEELAFLKVNLPLLGYFSLDHGE